MALVTSSLFATILHTRHTPKHTIAFKVDLQDHTEKQVRWNLFNLHFAGPPFTECFEAVYDDIVCSVYYARTY